MNPGKLLTHSIGLTMALFMAVLLQKLCIAGGKKFPERLCVLSKVVAQDWRALLFEKVETESINPLCLTIYLQDASAQHRISS